MNDTDLAWAAGFLDGEGSFYITRSFPEITGRANIQYRLAGSVTQKSIKPLERLFEIFGFGRIYRNKRGMYNFVLSSWQVVRALMGIKRFLVLKNKEADIAIDYFILHQQHMMQSKIGTQTSIIAVAQYDAYYWKLREAKNRV